MWWGEYGLVSIENEPAARMVIGVAGSAFYVWLICLRSFSVAQYRPGLWFYTWGSTARNETPLYLRILWFGSCCHKWDSKPIGTPHKSLPNTSPLSHWIFGKEFHIQVQVLIRSNHLHSFLFPDGSAFLTGLYTTPVQGIGITDYFLNKLRAGCATPIESIVLPLI